MPIGNIVESFLNKTQDRHPGYAEIFVNWEMVVGKTLAAKCMPYRVATNGSSRTLVLKSKKGCALELQHDTVKILQRVHQHLGKVYFAQIKIIQIDINDSL